MLGTTDLVTGSVLVFLLSDSHCLRANRYEALAVGSEPRAALPSQASAQMSRITACRYATQIDSRYEPEKSTTTLGWLASRSHETKYVN